MDPSLIAILYSLALFVGMMLCLDLGFRVGRRRTTRDQVKSADEGTGAIEAAVFGLLGLLLGFSFAGGTSRLDARRELIVREANAIGTAYLRLDLLPTDAQPEMRRLFAQYLDMRLHAYHMLPDLRGAEQDFARAEEIQQKIWSSAISASRSDSTQNVARLLLPALNDMIDCHHEPDGGHAHAFAWSYLRAFDPGDAAQWHPGRPCDVQAREAERHPHVDLCGRGCGNGIRGDRSRPPALGVDSAGCRR